MAEKATIARPYSRAAFEYAQASQKLARWSEFLQAASRVVADERVQPLLGNPLVPAQELVQLVLEIAAPDPSDDERHFLLLLAENRRLELLPEIAEQYESLRAEAEGTVDVTVTSALELTPEQHAKLSDALTRRLKRRVRLQCQVDPGLIGGAIVRAGDFVIDGSLKGRLERLGGVMTN